MLLTGIVCHDDESKTANLINSILSTSGKKISIIDLKSILEVGVARLKKYIKELEKNGIDILILKINITDVINEVLGEIRFDIIICTGKTDELFENSAPRYKELMDRMFKMLDEKGIAIVNIDDEQLIKVLEGISRCVVTYGFNSKANVTASSIGDTFFKDNFLCCLQSSIHAKNGKIIEPHEYVLEMNSGDVDTYQALAAAAFIVANGIELS